jgi:hypothetical protein
MQRKTKRGGIQAVKWVGVQNFEPLLLPNENKICLLYADNRAKFKLYFWLLTNLTRI